MKLLIISHTAHYYDNSQIKGWGATVREIDQLARIFDKVTHVAPLHEGAAPESALAYQANIEFRPVPPAGGTTLIKKLGIIRYCVKYARTFLMEASSADVVHVRCPANIGIIVIVLLAFMQHPQKRWIKYAGNWRPTGKDALSYRFQRWWLRHNFSRAVVTVNGEWPDSPEHVHAFLNPCLTNEELNEGRGSALFKELKVPLRFVFVGRLEETKGVRYALEVIAALARNDIPVHFDLIGDGPERSSLEELATQLRIQKTVTFHGWKARDEVNPFNMVAHFFLFPSYSSEGWPKVLSEAMAYGVVPLAGNISSIPQYLKQFETGRVFPPGEIDAFRDAVLTYYRQPGLWKLESANGVAAASLFTYDAYLDAIRQLLDIT